MRNGVSTGASSQTSASATSSEREPAEASGVARATGSSTDGAAPGGVRLPGRRRGRRSVSGGSTAALSAAAAGRRCAAARKPLGDRDRDPRPAARARGRRRGRRRRASLRPSRRMREAAVAPLLPGVRQQHHQALRHRQQARPVLGVRWISFRLRSMRASTSRAGAACRNRPSGTSKSPSRPAGACDRARAARRAPRATATGR